MYSVLRGHHEELLPVLWTLSSSVAPGSMHSQVEGENLMNY